MYIFLVLLQMIAVHVYVTTTKCHRRRRGARGRAWVPGGHGLGHVRGGIKCYQGRPWVPGGHELGHVRRGIKCYQR